MIGYQECFEPTCSDSNANLDDKGFEVIRVFFFTRNAFAHCNDNDDNSY